MKAKRLVLCLFLSLALTVTFIPITSFADDEYGTISLGDDWVQDEFDPVYWINYNGAEILFSEADFGDTDLGFGATVGNTVYMDIAPPAGQVISSVYHNGNLLERDEDSGSYSFVVGEDYEYEGSLEAGNNIEVYFDEDESGKNKFSDLSEIIDSAIIIKTGEQKSVTNEGLFAFTPTKTGTYAFYSYYNQGADPVGRVLTEDEEYVAESDDAYYSNMNFYILFDAIAGETYYLQAINYSGTAVFGVGLKEDFLPTKVSFESNGQHFATVACDATTVDYWDSPDFMPGDKVTVTYANNTAKVFVFAEKPDPEHAGETIEAFFNIANDKEELMGDYWLSFAYDFSGTSNKLGDSIALPASFEYDYNFDELEDLSSNMTVSIKFGLRHIGNKDKKDGMVKTAAAPNSCTTAGNIAYWYCENCQKYFSDAYGQNQIAAGAWTIPAAHKFTHVKKAAGLLKNGSEYDQCSVCGLVQNKKILPGYSKNFVKKPKVKAGKKSFTITWKKQSKATQKKFNGYQIRYSVKKSMAKAKMVKVKKTATSKTIKKLKKKTKYYVQVRTYTKKGGKTFYSKWSAKKTVKTK